MNTEEFNSLINHDHRCTVEYRDSDTGDRLKGLCISAVMHSSIDGEDYIQVNNFHTRVFIREVTRVIDTGKRWVDFPTKPAAQHTGVYY